MQHPGHLDGEHPDVGSRLCDRMGVDIDGDSAHIVNVGPTMGTERKSLLMFNISYRKVGGIRFLKIGRFFFSFGVSNQYRALHGEQEIAQ